MSAGARRVAMPQLPAIGWAALLCVVIMTIIVVLQLAELVPLALRGAAPAPNIKSNDGVATFQAALVRDAQRIDNRSPFFVPPRPAPKPVDRPAPVAMPVEKPKPADTSAPANYGGPNIIAMLGDSVWLDTGSRVSVGEEADGVHVLSTHGPWSARVEWRGREFDVTLFERTTDQFLAGGEAGAGETTDDDAPKDDDFDTEDLEDEPDADENDEPEDDEDGDA